MFLHHILKCSNSLSYNLKVCFNIQWNSSLLEILNGGNSSKPEFFSPWIHFIRKKCPQVGKSSVLDGILFWGTVKKIPYKFYPECRNFFYFKNLTNFMFIKTLNTMNFNTMKNHFDFFLTQWFSNLFLRAGKLPNAGKSGRSRGFPALWSFTVLLNQRYLILFLLIIPKILKLIYYNNNLTLFFFK